MTVRRIHIEDIPVLVEFLRVCFEDGRFADRGIVYDPNTTIRVLLNVITGAGAGWIAVEGHRIIGAAILLVIPRIANLNQRIASEVTWHPEPTLSKFKKFKVMAMLLEAMEGWAETFKMPLVVATNSEGQRASVGKYLSRRGYCACDTAWQKG